MKVKLALYGRVVNIKSTVVFEANSYTESDYNDKYIRLSDIVEVDFIELSHEETSSKEIAIIEIAIKNEMVESESRINHLKQRKQELLAIGNDNEI